MRRNDLARFARELMKHRAQAVVPLEDRIPRAFDTVDIERTGQRYDELLVCAAGAGIELLEQPETLLRERQRRGLFRRHRDRRRRPVRECRRAITRGDRRCMMRLYIDSKRRDRRLVENRDQHDVVVEQALHRTGQAHRRNRIAAELEEILCDTGRIHVQDLGPQSRKVGFEFGAFGHATARRPLPIGR